MRRPIALGVSLAIAAALLAFPLRQAVYQLVVIPVAYVWWLLGLLYRGLPQAIWWFVVLGVVLYVLARSLLSTRISLPRMAPMPAPREGNIESLASALHKAQAGIYFKWLVANRLGKLAYQILQQKDSGNNRSMFLPLMGEGWDPEPELQRYFEKGLNGSFTDFPTRRFQYFSPPPPTVLDYEVEKAVDYLEAKLYGDPLVSAAPIPHSSGVPSNR